jgi:hypothetical protein
MADQNVCRDQPTFNGAFKGALNEYYKVPEKDRTPVMIAAVLYLLLMIWALILAMRVSDPEHRVLHLSLAILVGPLYIISYYLGMMKK